MRLAVLFLAGCAFHAPGESAREACDAFLDNVSARAAECHVAMDETAMADHRASCGHVIGGDADGVMQCIDKWNTLTCAGFYKQAHLATFECPAFANLQRVP